MSYRKTPSNQSIKRSALLFVVLALSAPLTWAQLLFTPPQKLNSSSGSTGIGEQLIAVDNLGNINVVWVEPTSAANIMFSRSTDGGLTFSLPVNVSNNPGGALGPSLAVDGNGNINLAWTGSANFVGRPNDIFFTRSTDGGNSFSTPVDVSGGQPAGGGFSHSLALDTAGNPNLVWSGCFDLTCSANSSVFFSRSTDGGATFSAPAQVSNDQTQSPQVVVDPGGNIDVVWSELVNGGGNVSPVFFSQSSDGGATFSTPITVSGTTFFPSDEQMAVDSRGNIYIVENLHPTANGGPDGDIWLAASRDGGATFSMTNLSNNPGSDGPGRPRIALDSAGNINVVWVESALLQVLFRRSTDGGATFSDPVNLANPSGFIDEPQIAVDTCGNITVAWDQNTNPFFNILVSRSGDGGSTFSSPQNISHDQQGSSEFPMIAVDSDDIYAVWQDDSPQQGFPKLWNIFFSRGVATNSILNGCVPLPRTSSGKFPGTVREAATREQKFQRLQHGKRYQDSAISAPLSQ